MPYPTASAWCCSTAARGARTCNAQLQGFQRATPRLDSAGVRVMALSVDDQQAARNLSLEHGLTFPLGQDADAHHIAEITGAFVNLDPTYLQSTGFLLDETGSVVVSVYSSGAIGRLTPQDILG